MESKLDYLLVIAGIIMVSWASIYWEDFYIAFKPIIWIVGAIVLPFLATVSYLWIIDSKFPDLNRAESFIKSKFKRKKSTLSKKPSIKERFDFMPKEKKAEIMFRMKKRIEQERMDNQKPT